MSVNSFFAFSLQWPIYFKITKDNIFLTQPLQWHYIYNALDCFLYILHTPAGNPNVLTDFLNIYIKVHFILKSSLCFDTRLVSCVPITVLWWIFHLLKRSPLFHLFDSVPSLPPLNPRTTDAFTLSSFVFMEFNIIGIM